MTNLVEIARQTNKWTVKTIDDMELILSPRLSELGFVTHAFTTRVGGKTKAPYDSFNLGGNIGGDDMKRDAISNRKKLCKALNINFSDLFVPGQVHSRNVEVVTERAGMPDLKGVDGLVTHKQETPLLLHFADCVPVIVVETKKKLVGIFHAGWRGTASNIVGHGVERMIKDLDGDPRYMVGAVGPAIGPCCYPTSDDVARALSETVSTLPDGLIGRNGEQPAPDLKAFNALQLLERGVKQVDVSDFCTACNPGMFYSHRQSGGMTGRQGAIVSVKA
jgi:YfiH family protein